MAPSDLKERFVKARVKLLKRSPFFGTLLLNAPWREEKGIPTAATDGRGLMFNPDFAAKLNEKELNGVIFHELGHVFLQHVGRMKDVFKVDPMTANLACDIVVNGIIDDNNLDLPEGAIRDDKLKHLSVREIYNILKQKQSKDPNYIQNKYGVKSVNVCLQDPTEDGQDGSEADAEGPDWKDIVNKAATIARMKKAGPVGAGMSRILSELLEPTIDWRTILYKYLTEFPTDFDGYDRRFMYNGLYIDDFAGTTIRANVYIDTSGSVDEAILTEFLSEVQGAIAATNHITGAVYTFDTDLYEICDIVDLDPNNFDAKGGGGTCFRPIFAKMEDPEDSSTAFVKTLHIILTDGYADLDLPVPPANASVLWAISPGGQPSDAMPHGEVIRIVR
jgi:predicted metal-dependent peptidase